MSRNMKARLIFRIHFLNVLFAICLLAPSALGQKTYRGILFRCLQDKWPEIQYHEPDRAFVPETGQNLAWDAGKKAWIDVKTGQSVMPFKTLRGAIFKCCLQRKWPEIQLASDPNRAFVPETGQNLAWDSAKEAWIDVKTGKCVCPECPPTETAQPQPPPPTEHALRTQPDLFEFGIGYSYINAPDEEEVNDLHGFNASLFVNVNSWLAFGGEFAAGFGDKSFRVFDEDIDVSLDRYVYLFGPRLSFRPTERFRIFAQAMVGGVHDDTEITFSNNLRSTVRAASTNTSFSSSADSWAFDFGIGADWRLTNHWSWRIIQADYLATTFSSAKNDNWQNNWRISTGIVFSFGGRESSQPINYSGKEPPISAK